MFISIEEVPHSNPSRHHYFVQVAPLSITTYNTGKDVPFEWGPKQKAAQQEIIK